MSRTCFETRSFACETSTLCNHTNLVLKEKEYQLHEPFVLSWMKCGLNMLAQCTLYAARNTPSYTIRILFYSDISLCEVSTMSHLPSKTKITLKSKVRSFEREKKENASKNWNRRTRTKNKRGRTNENEENTVLVF